MGRRRVAAACVIGNFLEYFDFGVYGFLAVTIGHEFFPGGSGAVGLLKSLAVFGVAFVVRPLGGLVFGLIGDRAGRKVSLSMSVALMGVATTLIGVLPSYATIGIAAPVLLVFLRCLQGLAVGGEWGASSAYLIETAPSNRRGIPGSFPSMAAAMGLIFGAVLSLIFQLTLTADQLNGWGWRIPFLIAAPLAAVGLYVRQRLEDTPIFDQLEKSDVPRARLKDALRRDQAKAIFVTFAFSWICGVGLFFLGTYVVNYLTSTAHVGSTRAVVLTSIGLAVYCVLCPVAGRMSDRFGRRRTLLFGCLGHIVFGIPVFMAMSHGSSAVVIVALIVFAIFQAPINANTSLILIEMFPASTRLTSGALGFNLGVGAPSGFAPLLAAALVVWTGLSYAPGILLVGVALVCGAILLRWLPETGGRDLSLDVDAMKTGPAPTIAQPATMTESAVQ
jgi:MHS family proline/betaine transporter-like MFS transporter